MGQGERGGGEEEKLQESTQDESGIPRLLKINGNILVHLRKALHVFMGILVGPI